MSDLLDPSPCFILIYKLLLGGLYFRIVLFQVCVSPVDLSSPPLIISETLAAKGSGKSSFLQLASVIHEAQLERVWNRWLKKPHYHIGHAAPGKGREFLLPPTCFECMGSRKLSPECVRGEGAV